MQSCCVLSCYNRQRNKRRKYATGTRFFHFPAWKRSQGDHVSDVTRRRRQAWVTALNRKSITFDNLSKYLVVCSRHFIKGKPSYEMFDKDPDWAPSLHLGHGEPEGESSVNDEKRSLKRRRDENEMAKRMFENMISGRDFDIKDLQIQHVHLLNAFTKMQKEADELRAANEKLENALQSDFSKLSYRFLKCDNEQLLFLTGLHAVAFDWLAQKVARCVFRVHPEVNPQDHLLIVLMKLKLGLCDDDLGYRFQIVGGIITAICQTWIPTIAGVLSPLVEWQSQDAIVKTKPRIFKGKVRRCRCIIDTLEVTVETINPSTKVVSYLIGTTPAGAISFVSPGFFCKKKSDRQLIKESGFMDCLKPMDMILTNKTFSIQKDLSAAGVTLITPNTARGKRSASAKAKDFPATVWRHVEKVTKWWKEFDVFQTAIPEAYEEMLDDVVVICAALTNIKMSLVPQVKNTEKC